MLPYPFIIRLLLFGPIGLVTHWVQAQSAFDPTSIRVRWELIKNESQPQASFQAALSITNTSQTTLPLTGWKLYFSLRYHGSTLSSLSKFFTLTNVNGDLFYIQPTAEFSGLKPKESIRLTYSGIRRIANYQDAPSGFFWVNDASLQTAIALPPVTVTPFSANEKSSAALAASRFDENALIQDIPVNQLPKILPTPVSYQAANGIFTLTSNTHIVADSAFRSEATYLNNELRKLLGNLLPVSATPKAGNPIRLQRAQLAPEAYELRITPQRIVLSAADGAGIFYGIQSLKALLPIDAWASTRPSLPIPSVTVSDSPRFPVRAFMLDVSRNFQPKAAVLKLLDVMAFYKLNVFHFHLTDDEGWRLAIPDLPELTQIGSQRGYPFAHIERLQPAYGSGVESGKLMGSGFYSRADFIEILRYATQRHIQVIPEIESPGHARAAVKAMEARYITYTQAGQPQEANRYRLVDSADSSLYRSAQYFTDNVMNPVLPSTYRFIEKVIDELQRMYTEAGAPLSMVHMGGDEVPHGAWTKSPAITQWQQNKPVQTARELANYFFSQVKSLLKVRGLALTGWEELVVAEPRPDAPRQVELIPDFIQDKVQLNAWYNLRGNEDIPYRIANAGYQTVMIPLDYLYFNLAYKPAFNEPGDAWIGYLDIDKIFGFIPFDYYRNNRINVVGNRWPTGYFDKKVKLSPTGKQHILGLKGALWSENIRADTLMEYMILPRLLALAERAWASDPDWAQETDSTRFQQKYTKSWSVFINTVGKRELPRLDVYNGGYRYRIPAVGIKQLNNKLVMNCQLPGLQIRYTTDGSQPTPESPRYTAPILISRRLRVNVFSPNGRSGLTTELK